MGLLNQLVTVQKPTIHDEPKLGGTITVEMPELRIEISGRIIQFPVL